MSLIDKIKAVRVPTEGRGMPVLLSISGGKDSVAMWLACMENGVECHAVTADTVWESKVHAPYMAYLSERIAPIQVVGKPGGMPLQLIAGRMPGRLQRWCTEELKKEPLLAYHESVREVHGDTIAGIGIRRDEATTYNRRGTDPAWEFSDEWDGWIWRPILDWTTEDCLLMHRRHNIDVHPLYQRGHDRVGCYPCIFASKEELRLIAEHEPERIREIAMYEENATALRISRNEQRVRDGKPARYKHEEATFFQTRRKGFSGIREVVTWAQTENGGRQLPLLPPPPTGGCMRWGLCERSPDVPGGT